MESEGRFTTGVEYPKRTNDYTTPDDGFAALPGGLRVAPVHALPVGRTVELPGRGWTYVVDSGPAPDQPTFVMLHSVACTGLMTWYPAFDMMRRFGRVVVFDQRWHGHGIHSAAFSVDDLADDVIALADVLRLAVTRLRL